jgi:hypothetical protein
MILLCYFSSASKAIGTLGIMENSGLHSTNLQCPVFPHKSTYQDTEDQVDVPDVLSINMNQGPAHSGTYSTPPSNKHHRTMYDEILWPRTVIDATNFSARQSYSLATGTTKSYFDHRVRGGKVSQLLVLAENGQKLLGLLKHGHDTFVQTERAYWNTYNRIILSFSEGFNEDDQFV